MADFNNQNIVYDQSQGHGQNQGIQRSDSRGATNKMSSNSLNPNNSTQSQSGYPAYAQQNQYNDYGTNHYGGSAETRRSSQQGGPPSRPASGQDMHVVNQHRQSTRSPRPSNFSNTQQHSTYRAPNNSNAPISKPSSTHTHTQRESDSHPRPAAQTNRENAAFSSHKQAESGPRTSVAQRSGKPHITQLPSIANVTNTHSKNNETQNPTTVDPNQIFNHYEYQKRQAAIAAEAEAAKKRAAEEAEEARKKTEAAKQIQQLSQANGANGTSEEARKEEMEAEMRLMLEKMREYKSKDPTLFSQIWEQVKKAQPPGFSKDAAQPSAELPASREVALPSPDVTTIDNHNDPPPSNALQISPQADSEGLPDRGKFPAARRGRPGRRSRGGRTLLLSDHGQPTSVSHDTTDTHGIDAPNAPDPNSQLAGSVDAPDLTSTSKEPTQKVWVSGKQAQASQKKSPKARISSQSNPSSAPVEQQAQPRPSGQTVWPEKDKWTLAIAARDTLLLNPVNVGKTITPEEVHKILNEGPSYEELCKILEAKGFVVDRTPFARQLLSAVPRLQDSQSRPPPAPVSSFASHPPPAINPQLHASRVEPSHSQPSHSKVSKSSNVAPTAPMFGVLQPRSGLYTPGSSPQANGHSNTATTGHSDDQQRSKGTPPSQMYSSFQLNGYSPSQQPEVPAQQSVSKQQAARKTDFADIVDLTAENAEDEELARQRDEQLRKIKQMQQVKAAMDAAIASKSAELPPVRQKPKDIHLSPGVGLSSSAPSEDETTGSSRSQGATSRKTRKSKNIVKSIQRVDALRRSSYDERTIARDILIAAGRHPTMSALNYHLDSLRDRFRHVDHHSDLSTFDWASVDPGGPPVKPRYVEDSVQVSRPDDVDDADDEDAGPEVIASEPRKFRRAVTNGTGDTIMSDVSPPGPVKGFFSSPLTIRGRGRPRGRGPRPTRGGMNSRPSLGAAAAAGSPSQHASPPTQTFATPTRIIDMDNRGDVSMLAVGISAPVSSFSASRHAPSTPFEGESLGPAQPSPGTSEKKRRGRPPKNKTSITIVPTNSTPQSSLDPPFPSSATSSSQKPSLLNPPASVMPEPRVVGSSYQRTTTPARPSGLRNQIAVTSPFAIVIPQRSPSVVELSESSQPRKSKKVKRSPPPKYQVYKCRWKDCEGKLHNLETLRKHVRNHINELDGDLICLWSGCGTTKIAGTSTDESALQPLSFKSETAWERHMDGRHLDHYAWELGDGPSTHPSGTP